MFSLNKVKKSFTSRPGDLFFCDAGDRKQTIFKTDLSNLHRCFK